MRSLQPMNRLRLMLPCLEAVEGGRGRLGHRSTFSTCQCARSIGASTGVDPQRNGGRRRRIDLAGHDQCRSAARRPFMGFKMPPVHRSGWYLLESSNQIKKSNNSMSDKMSTRRDVCMSWVSRISSIFTRERMKVYYYSTTLLCSS